MTVDADHRLLSEHTTDIVMRVRLDGVIEWVSPVIQEVLGFSPDQWVGRRASMWSTRTSGRIWRRRCSELRRPARMLGSSSP